MPPWASQPTPAAQRCYAFRRPRSPQLLLAAPTCTLCNLPFLLVSMCTTHPPTHPPCPPGSLPLWCSQPYSQRDVEELARQRDISSLSPFYLDLQDEVLRIQASIGSVVWMCVFFCGCQAGQLGMQHCSSGMHRGSGPGQLAQSQLPLPLPAPAPTPTALGLQAVTDKLKGMGSELLMATTRQGDLHLLVHTTGEHRARPVGWRPAPFRGCDCRASQDPARLSA